MNIRSVTGCPKCTSDDIELEYTAHSHGTEAIKVACNDCGYFFFAACADDGGRLADSDEPLTDSEIVQALTPKQ